jgi:hypothetical protein
MTSLTLTPARVAILMAVDVQASLASNSPANNLYVFDTQHRWIVYQHRRDTLTVVAPGDLIVWTAIPIDPGTNVTIKRFGGTTLREGDIAPHLASDRSALAAPASLASRFQPPPNAPVGTRYPYDILLSFEDDKIMRLELLLQIG